jgi:hypothetical protein
MKEAPQRAPDVRIDERGEVLPLGESARASLQMRRGYWRFTPSHDGLLVLESADPNERAEEVVLSGTIEGVGLLDLINFLCSAQKNGALTILSGDVCKALLLEGGSVVSAMSNREEDRLGELLYRYGKITREQLAAALGEVGTARHLGKVLLDRGLISSHELWSFIRKQVEEIFFGLLLVRDGSFYFSVPGHPDFFPAHVPMSSQGLLMEGVRRMDELSYFRQLVPNENVTVVPKWPPPPGLALEPREEMILKLCEGPVTVGELARLSKLGEFEATKSVFHLLKVGALRKVDAGASATARTPEEDRLVLLLDTFNQIFREITAAIDKSGRGREFRAGITSFLASQAYPELFRNVGFDQSGEINTGTILANVKASQAENRADYLYSGLNELLFFEIFEAREILGRDEEQSLMQRVNQFFRQLR